MKQDMFVVGIKAVGDGNILEVELITCATAKKKTDVMGQIMGGDVMGAVKSIRNAEEQYRTKVYLSREWCSENAVWLFTSMTIDVNLADKDMIAKKYKS